MASANVKGAKGDIPESSSSLFSKTSPATPRNFDSPTENERSCSVVSVRETAQTPSTAAFASPDRSESWELTLNSMDSALHVSQMSISTTFSGLSSTLSDTDAAGTHSGKSQSSSVTDYASETILDAKQAGIFSGMLDKHALEAAAAAALTKKLDSTDSLPASVGISRHTESVRFQSIITDPGPLDFYQSNIRTASSYGRTIDEDHVNFVLMYDMLTGIRHSVSVCQAKPSRPLSDQDFSYARTYNFLQDSNETTPSKYEFRFKDYCPWVFRSLREAFKIDAADYLVSLTGKYALSEIGSPGKSGSFFYFSQDFRYIIKTIRQSEHEFLRKILRPYYEHVRRNGNSLLTRFYGLHRVRMSNIRKIYFVVMGNVFPPHKDIHETYDLKGSTLGRFIGAEELAKRNLAALKDLNWIQRQRKLKLGPEKATLLMNQLKADCMFLARMKIMDYSLLVGIHYFSRGNKDNIRDRSMMMYEPTAPSAGGGAPAFKQSSISAAAAGDSTGIPREYRRGVHLH